MAEMTKLERVAAALRGDAVDRVPASFWGHNYAKEWSAPDLAEAMLGPLRKYDWDYLKVNPRATYYVEDWGCKFKPAPGFDRGPEAVEFAVKAAEDWKKIGVLDITRGVYGEHLEAVRLIAKEIKGNVPFVQTVFSPLSVAGRLVGEEDQMKEYMRNNPHLVHQALAPITETLAKYARACLDAGADGIFFATTSWATRDLLTDTEYLEFGHPYDLQVLAAVQDGATFNILHICRDNNMFDLLADYPVHAINWAATLPHNIDLAEGLKRTTKAVMGGVSEKDTLAEGTPEAVAQEVRAALQQTGGRRFLLAPGCSVPPDAPEANLWAAKGAL